ncbi:MAG: hypothetical protein HDR09_20125 [Lachnospiraceae bacterium]|nr:hypothetical protein [Lachnospiraceae bacterium]MBD5505983.1 hypothetical protein [Lachnospiraceae bacterium]
MDKVIVSVLVVIAGITLLLISAAEAVVQVGGYMEERDREHRQWIDPH